MAQAAPVAVVLRRGPAAWTHLTLWDTRRDIFTPGAWFRGRIYEEKCDLSSDGELFLYAAFQGRRGTTSYTSSWTALSRPPWLHALSLWPMGTTYGGGGRFVGDRRVVLRGAREVHPAHPLRGIEVVPGEAEPHRSTEEVAEAEWSGRDQRNRLVFTSRGRVFARAGGLDIELLDLTAQTPASRPAPDWAKRPLPALPGEQARQGRHRRRGC